MSVQKCHDSPSNNGLDFSVLIKVTQTLLAWQKKQKQKKTC